MSHSMILWGAVRTRLLYLEGEWESSQGHHPTISKSKVTHKHLSQKMVVNTNHYPQQKLRREGVHQLPLKKHFFHSNSITTDKCYT